MSTNSKRLMACAITVSVVSMMALPAAAFASETYLGKKNNHEYYYDTASNIKKRMTIDMDKATPSVVTKFKSGELAIKLVVDFASQTVPAAKVASVSFKAFENLVDGEKVKISSSDKLYWVVQTTTSQRHFYTYTSKTTKAKQEVFVDEKGKYDAFINYEPVGTGYKKASYSKKIVNGQSVERRPYKSDNELLTACARIKAHNGKEIWTVSPVLTAKWSK